MWRKRLQIMVAALLICLSADGLAAAVVTSEQVRIDLPDEHIQLAKPTLAGVNQVQSETLHHQQSILISKEQLSRYPELLTRALIPALIQNHAKGVLLLLPLYQQQKVQDPLLLDWAMAIAAREQGHYRQASKLYRKLLAYNTAFVPLRYQLAQVLFLKHDNEAAKDQFEKLRSEALKPTLLAQINQYLTALSRREQWVFQGGLSYLNERNVNNAPHANTTVNGWRGWQAEAAEGVSYHVNADKKWSLQHGFLVKFSVLSYGRYYWDNKKYNEFTTRISAGLGYQNAQTEMSIMPFIEQRWYGGGSSGSSSLKRFSKNVGIRLGVSHWLTARWQVLSAFEYGQQRYTRRSHLNGNHYLWSNTLLYMPNSRQYWFAGIDYSRDNADDKSDAYSRKGGRIGWGQEWHWGISSRVSLTYAHRGYKQSGFLHIRQKNKEYHAQLSLWHRDVHLWGITPRITWDYSKAKSNNPFYSYDKNRVYLEVSKYF